MTTHGELMAAIRLALGREPDLVLWPNHGGRDERANVRYGLIVGAADIIGMGPRGEIVAWEVKAGRDTVRPAQRRFLALVARRGEAAVLRSVEDAWARLQAMREGRRDGLAGERWYDPGGVDGPGPRRLGRLTKP